ncbi:MAG: Wzz/FepE/Etk N-terminal domain-containing protein, partial [Gammaproteobacteria bacterium]
MDSKLDTISQAMDRLAVTPEKHGLSRDEQVALNGLPASEREISRLRAELEAVRAPRARDTTLASPTTMLTTGVPAIDRVLLGAQGMTLRDVVETVITSRRLVFSIIVLVVGGAMLSTWRNGPVYRANALVQVSKTERSLATALSGSAQFIEEEATVPKEMQILESRSILGSVVDKLQLDIAEKPLHFPMVGRAIAAMNRLGDSAPGVWFVSLGEFWPLLSAYAWGGERITVDVFDVPVTYMGEDNQFTVVAGQDSGYVLLDPSGQRLESGTIGALIEVPLPNNERVRLRLTELRARPGVHFTLMREPRIAAVADLDTALSVKEQTGTTGNGLISVSHLSEYPKKSAQIVNEVVNTYVSQHVAHKGSEAQKTLQYMEQQLPPLKKTLEAAEDALNKFRLQRGTADLTRETQELLHQIVSIEATRSELLTRRDELLRKLTPQSPQAPAVRPDLDDSARETLRRFRAGQSAEVAAVNAQVNGLDKQLEVLNA